MLLSLQIQLSYLEQEMRAISKGLQDLVAERRASKKDGHVSKRFCKVCDMNQISRSYSKEKLTETITNPTV